jgi:hypothetical protein
MMRSVGTPSRRKVCRGMPPAKTVWMFLDALFNRWIRVLALNSAEACHKLRTD